MAFQIAIPRTRWKHLRAYSREVLDHMNGGSYKHNEDGSVDISLIRFKPDKIANALRRLFYVALTAAVALIGNQSRTIPQMIQDSLSPQSVAAYLRDPDVKAAVGDILKEVLAPAQEPEKPKAKPTTKRRPATEPQRLNRLRDEVTATNPLPTLGSMRFPYEAPPFR